MGLLLVFAAAVGVKLLDHLAAQSVLGQHAFYGVVDHELGLFAKELVVADFLEAADIPGV